MANQLCFTLFHSPSVSNTVLVPNPPSEQQLGASITHIEKKNLLKINLDFIGRHIFDTGKAKRRSKDSLDKRRTRKALPTHPTPSLLSSTLKEQ